MNERTHLDRLSITSPCPKRWEELTGEGTTRFCSSCELHVHDLSAMAREEAEALVEDKRTRGERLCATFVPSPEGGAMSREELRAHRRRRTLRRWLAPLRSAGTFLLGLLAILPGCGPKDEAPQKETAKELPAEPEAGTEEECALLGDVGYAGGDFDLELLRELGYAE